MQFQGIDYLEVISDIISFILRYIQPFITPIGEWMVIWITFILNFFPKDNLTIYIIIFVILIVSGVIINWVWSGDKLTSKK